MKWQFSVLLGCLTFALGSADARAATCDALYLDDTPQDVIIGQWGTVQAHPVYGSWVPPTSELGVCWRDQLGTWHLEQLACDDTTPSTDVFKIYTYGGDDYAAVLLDEHTVGLTGTGVYTTGATPSGLAHALQCEWGAIAPWSPNFAFGIEARMGTGADEFHGSPNDDWAASNNAFTGWVRSTGPLGWVFREYADADAATDMLCGGAGDDELYGDRDDDWAAGEEEWLDGGPGTDVCDGDPFGAYAGNSISDVVTSSCETRQDAWLNDTFFSCEDTENPVWAVYF